MNQVDVHPVPELCSDTQHTWAWTNRAVYCPGYNMAEVRLWYRPPGQVHWIPVSKFPLDPFAVHRLAQWTRGQLSTKELTGATA
jgi:hypothetical protein